MYVKLKKSKVLDHFVRGQIFGHIKTNPGAHYNEIKEVLGVANGVLAHHLRTLEREEFIKSRKDGLLKRFYPMDMNIDIDKHGIQVSQAQMEIVNIIKQQPGISQSEIARLLNKDRRAIAYHIKEMERMSMIRLERSGRESSCFLGDVELD
jgi:predicted transcriptional regulator